MVKIAQFAELPDHRLFGDPGSGKNESIHMMGYALQKQAVQEPVKPFAKPFVLIIQNLWASGGFNCQQEKIAPTNLIGPDLSDPIPPTVVEVERMFRECPKSFTQGDRLRE